MKEIIGIVIIISIIIISSFILQSYLERTSEEILSKLYNLKEEIKQAQVSKNNKNIIKVSSEIIEKWGEVSDIWATVVAHQELDNIKLSILEVNAALETNSLEDSLEEIDKTIFLVGHIQEKEKLKLKNIF